MKKVNYLVEAARLGQTTDYDKLTVDVWTNGSINPRDGVSLAAKLIRDHLNIFINLELDDYGLVETRRCGCLFESLGLTTHLRHIRSFRKLTGEGVSLVGSDMARVLEEVLPSTYGVSMMGEA